LFKDGGKALKKCSRICRIPRKPLQLKLLPLSLAVIGAVYIRTNLLRSRNWETAVSLAGPFSNLLLAIVLGLILKFAPVSESGIWPGLAFLALLQVTAAIFNLLPIPPFDGYGALRPHLGWELRERMDQFGQVSIFIVFLALSYLPLVGDLFWGLVRIIAQLVGVPLYLAALGQSLFMFWR
jgi:Zn-dependent protease